MIKKLKVAFIDEKREIYALGDVKPELLVEGIKELSNELLKNLRK